MFEMCMEKLLRIIIYFFSASIGTAAFNKVGLVIK